LRKKFLDEPSQNEYLLNLTEDVIQDFLDRHCQADSDPSTWDTEGLRHAVLHQFGFDIRIEKINPGELNRTELQEAIFNKAKEKYERKEKLIGSEAMRMHERVIVLNVLDSQWKDHLLAMDQLKEGIGLRGYGQRDPLVEYKKESFETFQLMMGSIEEETLRLLYLLQPVEEQERVREMERRQRKQELTLNAPGEEMEAPKTVIRGPKIGRNDPCPCGSGKKFKKCCALKRAS
jgi:preprotein translocase subunit SecA